MPGQMPARGAIEVKSTKDDAWVTADGDQVTRYLGKYRQVLVTNYRDFILLGQDTEVDQVKLHAYRWPQRMPRSGALQDALKVYLDPQKDMRQ